MLNIPAPGPEGDLYPSSTCSLLNKVTLGSGTWSSLVEDTFLVGVVVCAASFVSLLGLRIVYFDFCFRVKVGLCFTGSSKCTDTNMDFWRVESILEIREEFLGPPWP